MKKNLEKASRSYFSYLARCFPVMSASDEFDFLPRSEEASQFYDKMEDLDLDRIEQCINEIKRFQHAFHLLSREAKDLDDQIDLALLCSSTNGILIEFEKIQSWIHNPLFYLKIAFIGLDHALTKPAGSEAERLYRLEARLGAIPRLFRQAIRNIKQVPVAYYQPSLAMARDAKEYLSGIYENVNQHGWSKYSLATSPRRKLYEPEAPVHENMGYTFSDSQGCIFTVKDQASVTLMHRFEEVFSALHSFRDYIGSLKPLAESSFDVSVLDARVHDHFASKRSLDKIYRMAMKEWDESLRELKELGRLIDQRKTWQQLYAEYSPAEAHTSDTFALYGREIERLRSFFLTRGRFHGFKDRPLNLCATPLYLRSVRSSASFSASFSSDPNELALFYISPGSFVQSRATGDNVQKRLNREFKFLSAHETYPGHHMLDTCRLRISNPVRRQIENPLFYEGWAYYAESLLDECGYVEEPIEILVDRKRRLWRAARCRIDVGLATGKMNRGNALALLGEAGFNEGEAERQVNHFGLNPGYQLCYSLGRYEIVELRKQYEARIGWNRFHGEILKEGEVPFHLLGKRFEQRCTGT